MEKLIIKSRNQIVLVDYKDIISLNALGRYTQIITLGKNHLSCKNLGMLEYDLPDYFYRIHDSFVINLYHLITINNGNVTMSNGVIFKLAKNRKKKFSEHINVLFNHNIKRVV